MIGDTEFGSVEVVVWWCKTEAIDASVLTEV